MAKTVQIHRARLLWLGPGKYLSRGQILVGPDGRILAIQACRGPKVPSQAILPGLVNAHVHLQIPRLSRPRNEFLPWLRAVMRARRQAHLSDYSRQGILALQSLLADGVTAIGEVDSTGASPALLRTLPLGGRCYQEITGFELRGRDARQLVQERRIPGSRWCTGGLSPHAPYSVSQDLFRAAGLTGLPLTVHVAETPEELHFLRRGVGPFKDLLQEMQRLPKSYRPPRAGAVQFLDRLGILSPRCLLVHAQHLSRAEEKTVLLRRAPIVVCPGTIQYFGRSAPPVPRWIKSGIPVALGTDSLASNRELSIRREMRLAGSLWPELLPEEILNMATVSAGVALGRSGLGRLVPGAAASFLTVQIPAAMQMDRFLQEFTSGALLPAETWLRGKLLQAPA